MDGTFEIFMFEFMLESRDHKKHLQKNQKAILHYLLRMK